VTTDREDAEVQTESTTAPLGARPLGLLFLVVLAVHALSPVVQVTDSRLSVPTASAVLHRGSLRLDSVPSVGPALAQTDYDVVRRDGATLPFFPWPPMLLALPGVAIADLAGVDVPALRPSDPNETFPIEMPTAALLVAMTAVVIALLVLEVTPAGPRAARHALGVALVFAFGTAAWSTASRSLWQHTPAMLCAGLALLAAVRSGRNRRYLWLLGAALAIGFTMRPTGAVPLVVLGLWSLGAHRREAWRVVAACVAVAVPFVAVNLAAYGSLLAPYYAGTRIGNEVTIGFGESLLVHLVSPSRGLLVYTPMFLLAPLGLWLRKRAGRLGSLDIAVAVTAVAHWLVIAGYGSTAGSAYGARFFTEVVPYLLYLCLPVFERAALQRDLPRPAGLAVAALVVLSIALTFPGATTRAAFCWSATPRVIDEAPERLWDWSDPQFLRPGRRLAAGVSVKKVVVGACADA